MAKRIFRGDAPTAKQITRIRAPLDDGTIVLRVGNKSLAFDSWDAAAIASGWNAATWPEFREAVASSSGTELFLTARTAGVPFFVVVTVGESGPGSSRNETQILTLVNGANGGTFHAEFSGDDTDIAWNADGDEFQTALEGLDSIEPGDVAVTGPAGGPWTVTFGGRFAGQNVPAIVVDGANLTGGNALVQIDTVQNGGGTPSAESVTATMVDGYSQRIYEGSHQPVTYRDLVRVQQFTASNPAQSYLEHGLMRFQLHIEPRTNITAAVMNVVLYHIIVADFVAYIGPNTTATFRVYGQAANNPAWGNYEILTTLPLTTSFATVTVAGGNGDRQLTGLAAVIQEIIDRPGWQSGNYIHLHIRTESGGPMTLAKPEDTPDIYWGLEQPELVIHYSEALREIQTVELIGSAIRAGSVTLTLADQTAAALPHNATAPAAQAALAALSNVGAGMVTASGGPWPSRMTLTFDASLGNLPQLSAVHDLLNGSIQNTTAAQGGPAVEISETQRSRGPNHWDDPLNWQDESGAFGVPQDGDAVYCPDGRVDLLYGLLQRCRFIADPGTDRLFLSDGQCALRDGQAVSVQTTDTLPGGLTSATTYYVRDVDPSGPSLRLAATPGGVPVALSSTGSGLHAVGVRLTLLETDARSAGKLGLPRCNTAGFAEYRPRFLAAWVERALIGTGNGSGSQRCHLDTGASPVRLQLRTSGGGTDNAPAVQLLCDGAGNTVEVLAGQLGLAIDPEQSGAVDALAVRSGQVLIGRDVALGEIERTGGNVVSLGATLDGKLVL